MTDFNKEHIQAENNDLTLTIPLLIFKKLLSHLVTNPSQEAWLTLGHYHGHKHQEWLVRDLQFQQSGSQPTSKTQMLRVKLVEDNNPIPAMNEIMASFIGFLFCHHTEQSSHTWGHIKIDGKLTAFKFLNLVGPGFHILPMQRPSNESINLESPALVSSNGRWSRTIGALGLSTWQRLSELQVAVIGCGRTGSLVASSLVRLGVQQLKLIDPDYIDLHNLGEMDLVTTEDLYRPKVEALISHLNPLADDPSGLHSYQGSITDATGLEQIKTCEVLFSCVDNDSARLTVAMIATLYHRVLIDIGTGIFYDTDHSASPGTSNNRSMGADIRLIVPADGCLLCWGNLSDYRQALAQIVGNRTSVVTHWQNQRAGSLHSLNQMATSLALQLLQDLAAERISGSIWVQVTFDAKGKMKVNYSERNSNKECPLCCRVGEGDSL